MADEALTQAVVGSIGKVDLTPLKQFEAWKDDLVSLDLVSAPLFMRRYLKAYEWSSQVAIELHKRLDKAILSLEHEEASAVLDRFTDYFEASKEKFGKMKDSSALRERYLALDPEYQKAREKVIALKALVKLMDVKAESFRMAHDDAKKIYQALIDGAHMTGGGSALSSREERLGEVEK